MKGFERQIRYLKNFGEFIELNDATNLLNSGEEIKGRYFCLTFDDGYSSDIEIVLPELQEINAAATFFIGKEAIILVACFFLT